MAMLQAVNVPASPETNANTSPAAVLARDAVAASSPSSALATLPPMTWSTNS
uniref:hypothetical protein n=1 Tax=Saccharothrix mutabilis TaxID=33921 RepID=UPI0031D3ED7B